MKENQPIAVAPAEQPGGCNIIRLSSGKRVLCSAEPLSDHCLFSRPESALLIGILLEGRLTFMVDGRRNFSLAPSQFGIYRSQAPFGPWRLQAEMARFVIIEGQPHVASVCPVGTGDRDVPACLCCPNYRQPTKTLVAPLPEALIPEVAALTRLQPRSFGDHLQMEARLLHLIGDLIVDTAAPTAARAAAECPLWLLPEDRSHLEEVASYLQEHLGDDHSLASLCQRFYLNECKLKGGFKQVFGETVFRYLRRRRMERARELIEQGEATVTQIALEIGYSNPSQFSAAFSAHWGIKPKQYQLCCRLRPRPSVPLPGEA
jgi:AraC-like DNA-binding protein